jgi:hypothetical protein
MLSFTGRLIIISNDRTGMTIRLLAQNHLQFFYWNQREALTPLQIGHQHAANFRTFSRTPLLKNHHPAITILKSPSHHHCPRITSWIQCRCWRWHLTLLLARTWSSTSFYPPGPSSARLRKCSCARQYQHISHRDTYISCLSKTRHHPHPSVASASPSCTLQ